MIKYFKFLILLVIFLTFHICAEAKTAAELVKVQDGDTVVIKIKENNIPVRLTGIDCFETYANHRSYMQAYLNKLSLEDVIKKGNKSKKYLLDLSKKTKKVYFEFEGIDNFKRALGRIYFDELDINEEMLNNGGCMIY